MPGVPSHQAQGGRVALEGIRGLDIMANAVEPNGLLSPHLDYYGSIHNGLHGVLGKAHDPLGLNKVTATT